MFNIGESINGYFGDGITQILQEVTTFISKILFEPKAMPDFFNRIYLIFVGFGATVMGIIIAFKIVQYIMDVSNDQTQANVWEIITRAFKASFMIIASPVLLTLIVGKVVYPLGEFMFTKITTDLASAAKNYIISMGSAFATPNSYVFIIMLGFILVAVTCFFFKMCIYQADLILLQILSVWAAISMCADDNNYMSVWWREVISQITTILVQTLLMVGVTSILASKFEWQNLMLLIGFCSLLIKGPSVLRNMWYSTGSGKTAMSGGKIATRWLMMKGKV